MSRSVLTLGPYAVAALTAHFDEGGNPEFEHQPAVELSGTLTLQL